MPSAIEVSSLAKRFGSVEALAGIDLEVPPGTVFGLLGPNGAGKTTAVRILTTILRPDSGDARVLGLDVVDRAEAVRGVIGLAGQYAAVDGNLTARENLRLAGWLTDNHVDEAWLQAHAEREARARRLRDWARLRVGNRLLVRPVLDELRLENRYVVAAEKAAEHKRLWRTAGEDVGSLDEWLRSLKIRVRAEPLKPENLARISQLINKTNQMNLRTRRMSEAELAAWATRPGHAAWGFTVDDRFGSSGLTGVVGLRYQGRSAFFEDFVLSCRVIGRRIEETMVHLIQEQQKKWMMN